MLIEERRNIKKAVTFVVLSVLIVLFLASYGLPFMAKFAGIFSGLKKQSGPIEKIDITPPAPPKFSNIPDVTNSSPLEISGSVETGSTVVINFNNKEDEILADKDGQFSTKVDLKKGENTLFAVAKDAAGNQSQKSTSYEIVFNNEPPKIEILTPSDGTSFFGTKQQIVTLKGITNPEVNLTVNDRIIQVKDDGSFSYNFSLADGENNLTFKAVDQAGNETEASLKLNYSP